jgi:hypothetical protein
MTTTNRKINYKKTTANDGGRTSPTSCRQEYLFTVVTEADVELERPGNQLQRQRQTMGDELVQHLADKNLCSRKCQQVKGADAVLMLSLRIPKAMNQIWREQGHMMWTNQSYVLPKKTQQNLRLCCFFEGSHNRETIRFKQH